MDIREALKDKKRIVIKIGTSTITHENTGNINLEKLEKFVRILVNLRNKGKEVIVVSSGAVGIGSHVLGLGKRPASRSVKQACAAVGQGRLMMMYEKLFAEYSYLTAQVLLTKESILETQCRENARKTFEQLLKMEVVPVVNENDAISVNQDNYGKFGDNDTMSAHVAELVDADLLILMSDIEGLYTDDPKLNPHARFVHTVSQIDEQLTNMCKGAGSEFGTGGMLTKIEAAKMATDAGADMVIANGDNIYVINDILAGKKVGTLFLSEARRKGQTTELAPERLPYRRKAKHQKRDRIYQTQGGNSNDVYADARKQG